ncbi:type II and III secretion system protein [Rhodospirillum rubrum F11]|uniref:Type II and III secretion system protein n=3 Tax=Rhodospirillum rubrum TaxID=1085 RepID=Q2RY81_RHORT|nr:type II and III secretion system protein [Rhodospirillum rubrum]ABC20914.1 type II and III secretion system protein [Rhodospirillum rubrum ATCC 11170]AEO46582.1 type II and III secretion system protein [Rhodospirillum rubrum F11]MBK5952472.1 type II and III secretion system protein [Rhodospirillum rubrum]
MRAPVRRIALLCALMPGLAGCEPFDGAGGLTKDDYRALLARRGGGPSPLPEPPIPPLLEPQLAALPAPEEARRVTVIAQSPTPVADLLVALCREVGVDLEMSPEVGGLVVLSLRDRPFPEVVGRLGAMAGLDITLVDGVVRVDLDRPLPAIYHLDALNMARSSEGSVSTSTDVFTSVAAKGNSRDSRGNASASLVSSASKADLWGEVAGGLGQILGRAEGDPLAEEARDGVARGGFHINRQAGLITVVGRRAQQREVADYLAGVRQSMATQVLIEAKIVEVTLKDQYRGGIDWKVLTDGGEFLLDIPGAAGVVAPPLTDAAATLSLGTRATLGPVELSALVQFIKTFGAVRTLSSPRLTVMNNQTAVLKVAENEVYFVVDVDTVTSDGVTQTTYSSEINTVPIGLVMTVQPSVEPGGGRVTLGLRPTISRIADRVADPAVSLQNLSVQSLIPVVEVRELDSVVTIDNGAVVVMGGLMQERMGRDEEGVPGLGDVPLIGRAFRHDSADTDVVELVVLLRATVIGGAHSHPADRQLYRIYTPDPRPLAM